MVIKEDKVKKSDEIKGEADSEKEEEPRIGVFVCHCGHNIAGTVDVAEVAEYAEHLPNVIKAEHYMFMCSKPGVQMLKDSIEELDVNRTVVASCSKNQHGRTFAKAIEEMGLNRHKHQQVNIREYNSWVHAHSAATGK